jgi:hypothetical protein
MRETQRTMKGGGDEGGVPSSSKWVLPFWAAERVAGGYIITCPRRDCGRRLLVDKAWPVGGYRTRPCTYCFKAATIPDEIREEL